MSNVLNFLAQRWKAIVPLVLYGISEALKHGVDLETPTGRNAFIGAVLTAIVVHQVPNRPPA